MTEPLDEPVERGSALARTSLSIALWTLVSRVTGFARIAVNSRRPRASDRQ